MITLSLALATAVVCAPANPKLTPTIMREAAWRIPPHCVLIAPKHDTDSKDKTNGQNLRLVAPH